MKNMMLDTFNGKVWYPRFYDLDTSFSLNNSGVIKIGVDAEIEAGTFNTSGSRLWSKIMVAYRAELVEQYRQLRSNKFNYNTIMEFMYGEQISKIPQSYYNKDAQVKYLDFGSQYLDKLHGSRYEHMKQWVKNRLLYVDTLLDYTSTTDDTITIRANTLNQITFKIETYSPQYLRIKWKNGLVEKKKVKGLTEFTNRVDTATDQEILIYNASQIKVLDGLPSANPNSIDLANATRLTQLKVPNSTKLTTINGGSQGGMSGATLAYLNYLDLSGCTSLTGSVVLTNCPLISYVNVNNTLVNDVQLPSACVSLKEIWYPKAIQMISLSDLPELKVVGLQSGHSCKELKLINCPKVEAFGDRGFNASTQKYTIPHFVYLSGLNSLYLDNSFINEPKLYIGAIKESLTLRNIPSLEEIQIGMNTYELPSDTLMNKLNSLGDFSFNTFNCPKLKNFRTSAFIYGGEKLSIYYGKDVKYTSGATFTDSHSIMFKNMDFSNSQIENFYFDVPTCCTILKLPSSIRVFRAGIYMDTNYSNNNLYFNSADVSSIPGFKPFRVGNFFNTIWVVREGIEMSDSDIGKWDFNNKEIIDFAVYQHNRKQINVNGINTISWILDWKPILKNIKIKSINYSPNAEIFTWGDNINYNLSEFGGESLVYALYGARDSINFTLPTNYENIKFYTCALVNINTTKIKWSDEITLKVIENVEYARDSKDIILAEQTNYETDGIIVNLNKIKEGGLGNSSYFARSNLKYIKQLNINNYTGSVSLLFGRNDHNYETTQFVKVGDVNIPKSNYADSLFRDIPTLEEVGNINIPLNTNLSYFFHNCSNLKKVGNINIPSSSSNNDMFLYCGQLEEVGDIINDVTVSNCTNLFNGCSKLKRVGNLLMKPNNCQSFFNGCGLLESVATLPDLSVTTNISYFFNGSVVRAEWMEYIYQMLSNRSNMTVNCTRLYAGATYIGGDTITLKLYNSMSNYDAIISGIKGVTKFIFDMSTLDIYVADRGRVTTNLPSYNYCKIILPKKMGNTMSLGVISGNMNFYELAWCKDNGTLEFDRTYYESGNFILSDGAHGNGRKIKIINFPLDIHIGTFQMSWYSNVYYISGTTWSGIETTDSLIPAYYCYMVKSVQEDLIYNHIGRTENGATFTLYTKYYNEEFGQLVSYTSTEITNMITHLTNLGWNVVRQNNG